MTSTLTDSTLRSLPIGTKIRAHTYAGGIGGYGVWTLQEDRTWAADSARATVGPFAPDDFAAWLRSKNFRTEIQSLGRR